MALLDAICIKRSSALFHKVKTPFLIQRTYICALPNKVCTILEIIHLKYILLM